LLRISWECLVEDLHLFVRPPPPRLKEEPLERPAADREPRPAEPGSSGTPERTRSM
jgi:hypothetical protein